MVEDLQENRGAESEVYVNVLKDLSTASTYKSSLERGLERSLICDKSATKVGYIS